MKGRLAAALSLSGVLVAGSAAALVNSQVLSESPASAGSDTTSPDSSPDTSVAGSTPSTSVIVVDPSASTVPASGAATQATYQIGDAGLVTLDTAGDVLTIISATPNAGWMVVEAESEDPLNIEVKLQSATTLVEFHANLLFGVVSTSVEAKNLGDDSPDNTTGNSTSNSVDDHDDDDDDRGGDHDDDDDDDDRGDDDD
jgi:hypothetical protein